MKVVHITRSQYGGAALCVLRIHKALLSANIDSRVIVTDGSKSEKIDVVSESQYTWSNNVFVKTIQVVLCKLHIWPRKGWYLHKYQICQVNNGGNFITPPITYYDSLHLHPWIVESDLVHLHSIGGFVDFPTFFQNVKKPMVWTCHDCNPAFGIFHINRQLTNAPQRLKDLDTYSKNLKRQYLRNIKELNLIAVSHLAGDFLRKSNIFEDREIHIIPNGVDLEEFCLLDKTIARNKLNIPQNKKVVLFSSGDLYAKHKGLSLLLSVIEKINEDNDGDILLICVGGTSNKLSSTSSVAFVGYIEDSTLLSYYYSAADVYVAPSTEETFGQTLLEAMACGTPVVAFPVGIAPELINKDNGLLCKATFESLSNAIEIALETDYCRSEIRDYCKKNFSYTIIANKYIDRYNECLGNHTSIQ